MLWLSLCTLTISNSAGTTKVGFLVFRSNVFWKMFASARMVTGDIIKPAIG